MSEEVDLCLVVLERALDGVDALHEQRVGVLHVEVHEGHHGDAGPDGLDGGVDLAEVVVPDGHDLGDGCLLWLHWVLWLGDGDGGGVVGGDDAALDELVDEVGGDDGDDVRGADVHDVLLVLHVDAARGLHHQQHDGDVGHLWGDHGEGGADGGVGTSSSSIILYRNKYTICQLLCIYTYNHRYHPARAKPATPEPEATAPRVDANNRR